MAKVTYKDAGVDLATYEDSMARLPRLMQRTHNPRVLQLSKGFAGLFRLDFPTGPFRRGYKNPVLVSGTDGVGTKLKVAQKLDRHNTVGEDLVAMCVNDIICCGAEPLFFLDYVAMSHDDPELLEQIVEGISSGCLHAESALLGGETAIMPDLYQKGDYDLAGFSVGVVEADNVIDGSKIAAGDQLIAIPSNGFHSNGYSLLRKVVFEIAQLSVDDTIAELNGQTVGDVLLRPTRIYAKLVRDVMNQCDDLHGIAHITGGGLAENVQRILPEGLELQLDFSSWKWPTEFQWVQSLAEVDDDEMRRVFNCGIGLVFVTSQSESDKLISWLESNGESPFIVGRVAEHACGD